MAAIETRRAWRITPEAGVRPALDQRPSIAKAPERARERVERALDTARESLEEARRSVLDLRTAPLGRAAPSPTRWPRWAVPSAETGVRVHVRSGAVATLPADPVRESRPSCTESSRRR